MTVLLPCPFCGGEAEDYKAFSDLEDKQLYNVYCTFWKCKIRPTTIDYSSKANAIRAWNRRAKECLMPCCKEVKL